MLNVSLGQVVIDNCDSAVPQKLGHAQQQKTTAVSASVPADSFHDGMESSMSASQKEIVHHSRAGTGQDE